MATIGGYMADGRVLGWRIDVNPPIEGRGWEYRSAKGFYMDEPGGGDLVYPCVALVPGRGRYPGATLGEGMVTWIDTRTLYGTEEVRDAWADAWAIADAIGTAEREYQSSLCLTCYEPLGACECGVHRFDLGSASVINHNED